MVNFDFVVVKKLIFLIDYETCFSSGAAIGTQQVQSALRYHFDIMPAWLCFLSLERVEVLAIHVVA
jgi:hypothetical protein